MSLFSLSAGPYGSDDFDVVSFVGEESVSDVYSFEIRASIPNEPMRLDTLEADLLGQRASFEMRVGDVGRVIHGVVRSFRLEGSDQTGGRALVAIDLVPRLWLLSQRRGFRIFQEKTVPEIVDALLERWQIRRVWRLSRTYEPRTYCTQYDETDLDFLRRILAEEGIFFSFDQDSADGASPLDVGVDVGFRGASPGLSLAPPGGSSDRLDVVAQVVQGEEVLVFGEDPGAYRPIDAASVDDFATDAAYDPIGSAAGSSVQVPELLMRDRQPGMMLGENQVQEFTLARNVRPKMSLLSDFDFRRPMLRLRGESALRGGSESGGALTVGSGTSIVPSSATCTDADTPSLLDARTLCVHTYEDRPEHESSWPAPEVDSETAAIALEQLRHDAYVAWGRSACRRLIPGRTFCLVQHAIERLNRSYVVARVTHAGRVPEHQEDDVLDVYENQFECIPASRTCRPPAPPARMRQVSETATVVGPPGEEIHTDGYGRVKVQFHWDLGGKRDDRASCWMRVAQGWAGPGYGMQHIPRVGTEVLVTFLGGNPDRPIVTGCVYNGINPTPFPLPNDKARSGVRTQSTPRASGYNELSFDDTASREQIRVHAQKDFEETILNDHIVSVGAEESITVGGNHSLRVRGRRLTHTDGNDVQNVSGSLLTNVRNDAMLDVDGNLFVDVDVDASTFVRGASTTEVQGPHVLRVKRTSSTIVEGADGDGLIEQRVSGEYRVQATEVMTLRADKAIVLQCGDTVLTITPDGISMKAKKVEMKADAISAESKKSSSVADVFEVAGEDLKLRTAKASLELKETASLNGSQVLLGVDEPEKPEHRSEEGKPLPTKPLKLVLSDGNLAPYAKKHYEIEVLGQVHRGTTDASGCLEEKVPETAKVANLSLWVDEYPKGRVQRSVVSIAKEMAPAESVKGLLRRLKNLGYFAGTPSDKLDDAGRAALRWFQRDHDLPPTGEPDAKTKAKLTARAGKAGALS